MANKLPPPPPSAPASTKRNSVRFGKISTANGRRIGIYGTGGVGKTTLACSLPGPVAFIDLEGTLPPLRASLAERGLIDGIMPVEGVDDWAGLLSVLDSDGWQDVRTVVVDSATKAEAMCLKWMLANIPNEKGCRVSSIEGYGFGKGYTILAEQFSALISRLDRHAAAGRNVCLICHDCTTNVPNPGGEDFIRYEPRLQSPASGKASIRLMVKEWLDDLGFLSFDVVVDENNKAHGSGTRTISFVEAPSYIAKSRSCPKDFDVDGFDWSNIIK